jgi:hypothetical protein
LTVRQINYHHKENQHVFEDHRCRRPGRRRSDPRCGWLGARGATPPPHDGHAGGTLELSLNQGRKWETDEALRQGMTVIREAMVRSLGAIHVGTFTTTQYASLTRTLEDQVDGIIRNCRLPSEADAQLHIVLAEIFEGIDGLKSDKGRVSSAMRVLQALNAYGTHFDHAGWEPIGH